MKQERLTLAIIGVGLIGGSLGLCLKDKLGEDIYITGLCRTQASMDKAVELGAVDFASADIESVVGNADIVFLSPPVLQIVPMVEKILPYLKKGAILTDAGSTKQYIWQHLQKILPEDIYYIAGHPMTGREKSGVEAAKKDLFVGKAYVIVEDTGAPQEAHDKLMRILQHTGANFTTLDIAKHDRCASVISHVPHVAAAALVTLLNQSGGDMESCIKLIGGGFKDTTRIASSNADMWADICMTNGKAIAANLRTLQEIIGQVITACEQQDRQAVYDYFAASKKRRDALLENAVHQFDPN
ncbi:putative prephenate dehydrogenase [Selenomonas ruminantium subsp. lactilytica TAM6421]|uniref:Putative prephenate dehydrogenase n=1 Tax=Selenomonas ruminantium subsp. lactilytica (strain NBRC 103574 / TAM6421) TaxID=927704 RepID=I0GPN0_SELRL|nr:prephenate dehydrogenase/arogenate dehydrogenase family protein [Selenomonas ruminantium]BAL82717.1 putative prephenate dehydrogenase [Selenomonas ruminantium subsp. lactilytica TAM6421]